MHSVDWIESKRFSVWFCDKKYSLHRSEMLKNALRLQTLLALQSNSDESLSTAKYYAENALMMDPTDLRAWETLAMKKLDDYVCFLFYFEG